MAAISVRNVSALVRLGLLTVWHFLKLPFRRRRDLPQIQADYAKDGVALIGLAERASAVRARACTACGRCDGVLRDGGAAPSLLIPRLGREHGDRAVSGGAIARLAPVAEAIERVCPEQVDVRALLCEHAAAPR